MIKTYVTFGGFIAICVLLASIIFLKNNDTVADETVRLAPITEPTAIPASAGYQPYTATILDASNQQRRVLFFFANWCPTCAEAEASFQSNLTQFPSDLVVIKVNYADPETDANEKKLAQQYGITYQHTFVLIDQQGQAITTWNGGGFSELLAKVEAATP